MEEQNEVQNEVQNGQKSEDEDEHEQAFENPLFLLPIEVWKVNICYFLNMGEKCKLRLACKWFRLCILDAPPVWKQWLPFETLFETQSKASYLKRKWELQWNNIYGLYLQQHEGDEETQWQELITTNSTKNNNNNDNNSHQLHQLDKEQLQSQSQPHQLQSQLLSLLLDKTNHKLLPPNVKELDFHSTRIITDSIFIENCIPSSINKVYLHSQSKVTVKGIQHLYEHYPQLNLCFINESGDHCNILYWACREGNYGIAKYLFEHNKVDENSINATCGSYKCTPLYIASQNGFKDICELLLEHGADSSIYRARDQWTPLMTAAYFGHLEVVDILLKYNAQVHQKNFYGRTALDVASGRGRIQVIMTIKSYINAQKLQQKQQH